MSKLYPGKPTIETVGSETDLARRVSQITTDKETLHHFIPASGIRTAVKHGAKQAASAAQFDELEATISY